MKGSGLRFPTDLCFINCIAVFRADICKPIKINGPVTRKTGSNITVLCSFVIYDSLRDLARQLLFKLNSNFLVGRRGCKLPFSNESTAQMCAILNKSFNIEIMSAFVPKAVLWSQMACVVWFTRGYTSRNFFAILSFSHTMRPLLGTCCGASYASRLPAMRRQNGQK